MQRRVFLQAGVDAILAMAATQTGRAQGAPSGDTRKLKVDAYSRHLQWLRTADQVADFSTEAEDLWAFASGMPNSSRVAAWAFSRRSRVFTS